MRTILHSDLNNFYASVECMQDPSLRGIPVAVTGDPEARHGIVLAKNQLAKVAGVATGEAIWEARQKCPNLKCVPPHFEWYVKFSKLTRAMYFDYTDRVEPFGLDEAWLDVTCDDRSGEEIAAELRRRAREELGLTLSVGVSFNKIFAKLGSDLKKPDATTVISSDNFRERIWPLPARDLLGVGPATEEKLLKRNLATIGDVARCPVEILRSVLGKHGDALWTYANGLENSPVARLGEEAAIKSVGNSTTAPRDIAGEDDARLLLYQLSESVAERLREQGFAGRVVSVSGRDSALGSFMCQRKLGRATAIASEIARTACELLRANYHWERPVRSLGVAVSELRTLDGDEQLTMFPDLPRERMFDFEGTVAEVRRRFGHFSLQRAVFLADRAMGAVNAKEHVMIFPSNWKVG